LRDGKISRKEWLFVKIEKIMPFFFRVSASRPAGLPRNASGVGQGRRSLLEKITGCTNKYQQNNVFAFTTKNTKLTKSKCETKGF
jgi:hypothetical protein